MHLHADTSILLCGLRWTGGDDIMEKAFTWTLCFDVLESRKFKLCHKQSNGECLMGMFLYSFVILVVTTRITHKVSYIHIGVGSALLVSTNWAMRRPQKGETSDRYRFSRFSFYKEV